jgi:hypothetical protein
MNYVSKATAQAIIDELGPAINEVLTRHGLEAPKLQWKYGDWLELKATASLLEVGPHGINLQAPEVRYYQEYGYKSYIDDKPGNIKPSVKLEAPIGTLFSAKGGTYAFAGISTSRRKYPVRALNIETNAYTFFVPAIIRRINEAAGVVAS